MQRYNTCVNHGAMHQKRLTCSQNSVKIGSVAVHHMPPASASPGNGNILSTNA
jgi:hypothetical protein